MPEPGSSAPSAASVLRALDDAAGSRCAGCDTTLCGHDVVASLVSGHRHAPLCCECLAAQQQTAASVHAERMWNYVRGRDCYLAGWREAGRREHCAEEGVLPCRVVEPTAVQASVAPESRPTVTVDLPAHVDARWDAGDLACGDLVLELRRRLQDLGSGRVLEVRAVDPAAPEDLPAWCRLTGHGLVAATHPLYLLRAR